MKRPDLLFVTKFSFYCLPPLGNGGVKNKMLKTGSILTGENMMYEYRKKKPACQKSLNKNKEKFKVCCTA